MKSSTLYHYQPFDMLLQASLEQDHGITDSESSTEISVDQVALVIEAIKQSRQGKKFKTNPKICHNRECTLPCGYSAKPNSIYCSSRCQSREQNLRQGRVKNIRRPKRSNAKVN